MSLLKVERERLKKIRERFLSPGNKEGVEDYWLEAEDLRLYDEYFARRIYFKLLHVFSTLKKQGWAPVFPLLDYGCGSGVASEALLDVFQEVKEVDIVLSDRSDLAVEYSLKKLSSRYPHMRINNGKSFSLKVNSILMSHVLGELNASDLKKMENFLLEFSQVVLVEAGTPEHFCKIKQLREALKEHYSWLAPCVHRNSCPMVQEKSKQNWCHHFASVPEVFSTSAHWAEFSRELEVDLRSLPFSYLVLDQMTPLEYEKTICKSIGRARISKAYARIQVCGESLGLQELNLEKRHQPELYRAVKKHGLADYYKLKQIDEKLQWFEPAFKDSEDE